MRNFLRATVTVLNLAVRTSLYAGAKNDGGNVLNVAKRSRMLTWTAPILIGTSLLLSACAVSPEYGYGYDGYGYDAYGYAPAYASLGFFDEGGFFHRDRDDRDFDHRFAEHDGHGFRDDRGERGFGHGFAGHAGLGFHGAGGGHGGGGHGGRG